MSSLAAFSKEQLVNRNKSLQEKVTDGLALTNSLMVANGAALAGGFAAAKFGDANGQWKMFNVDVQPAAGVAIAVATAMGMVGKKQRRTALNISIGLTAPFMEKLGRALGQK